MANATHSAFLTATTSSDVIAARGPSASLRQRLEGAALLKAARDALNARAIEFNDRTALSRGWERWCDGLSMLQVSAALDKRLEHRARVHVLAQGLGGWSSGLAARRVWANLVHRALHQEASVRLRRLVVALSRWHDTVWQRHATRGAMQRSSEMGSELRLSNGFSCWRTHVAMEAGRLGMLRRAVAYMAHSCLAKGWLGWRRSHSERIASRSTLRQLLLRSSDFDACRRQRHGFDGLVNYCIVILSFESERRISTQVALKDIHAPDEEDHARTRAVPVATASSSAAASSSLFVPPVKARLSPLATVLARLELELSQARVTISQLQETLKSERREAQETISRLRRDVELRTEFPSLQSLSVVRGKQMEALKAGLDAARERDQLRLQLAEANARALAVEEAKLREVKAIEANVVAREKLLGELLERMASTSAGSFGDGRDLLNHRFSSYFSPPQRSYPRFQKNTERGPTSAARSPSATPFSARLHVDDESSSLTSRQVRLIASARVTNQSIR